VFRISDGTVPYTNDNESSHPFVAGTVLNSAGAKHMLSSFSLPAFLLCNLGFVFVYQTKKIALHVCWNQRWIHLCSFYVHRHKTIFRVYIYFAGKGNVQEWAMIIIILMTMIMMPINYLEGPEIWTG
jgi:hypothetical protein